VVPLGMVAQSEKIRYQWMGGSSMEWDFRQWMGGQSFFKFSTGWLDARSRGRIFSGAVVWWCPGETMLGLERITG